MGKSLFWASPGHVTSNIEPSTVPGGLIWTNKMAEVKYTKCTKLRSRAWLFHHETGLSLEFIVMVVNPRWLQLSWSTKQQDNNFSELLSDPYSTSVYVEWIGVCYLSSSSTVPPGWCRKGRWTPGPPLNVWVGGRNAVLQWSGSQPSSGGSTWMPPAAEAEAEAGCLHYTWWPPPWGYWQSQVPTPCCPCQLCVCGRKSRDEVRKAKSDKELRSVMLHYLLTCLILHLQLGIWCLDSIFRGRLVKVLSP